MDRFNLNNIYQPLNALLMLLVAWMLIRLLWLGLMPADPILPPAAVAQVQSAVQRAAYAPLSGRHLFGVFEEKQLVSHYVDAPETSLNLLLRGIVSGETDQDGFAIIRNSKGKEAVYRVGRDLPGGGEVRGIFYDRVVLFRDGQYETLRLRLEQQSAGTESFSVDSSASPVSIASVTDKTPLAASSVPSARSRYALNISAMASSYGLVKVPSGGYRINLGRNASQLVKLGLRNGDVIVSANGVKLDDEQAVESLIGKVMQGESLSLEVLRHGQKQMLQPDLKSLLQSP
ncbi:MAG: type II secretion system protein GspC [Xanthomonadales bacterium]|nr:type II secretion system protein GspC [Xanthomonadales bacterium]